MKNIRQKIIPILLLGLIILLLQNPENSRAAIFDGLQVCVNSILPALFPFFVLTELWISLGYAQTVSQVFGPLTEKLFHLPGSAASALVLGAVGGYPIGAVTASKLYETGQLSRQDAEHCLFFCNNAGPAFIVGLVGGVVFQNTLIGCMMWGIHLLSSILLGILFRPSSAPSPHRSSVSSQCSPPFLPALTSAIRQGGKTTIQVCIFVLFFSIITAHLRSVLPVSNVAEIFLSSLELAGGISRLAYFPLPFSSQFVLCGGLLGWGGVCVHCQSISVIDQAGLRCMPYLLGKLAHCMVSTALSCLIIPWVSSSFPCFAPSSAHTHPLSFLTFLVFALFSIACQKSHWKRRP